MTQSNDGMRNGRSMRRLGTLVWAACCVCIGACGSRQREEFASVAGNPEPSSDHSAALENSESARDSTHGAGATEVFEASIATSPHSSAETAFIETTIGEGDDEQSQVNEGPGASAVSSTDAGLSGDTVSLDGGVDPLSDLVPASDPREGALAGPLWWPTEKFDATTGAELAQLAFEVGRAQGYALCRCTETSVPAPDSYDWIESCAVAESRLPYLADPDSHRCIVERMASVPDFEDYLRCEARRLKDIGWAYLIACGQDPTPIPETTMCTRSAADQELIDRCTGVFYCADANAAGPVVHCDGVVDCLDQSDELDCPGPPAR